MLANLNIIASCWWSELYNCDVSVIFSAGTKLDGRILPGAGSLCINVLALPHAHNSTPLTS